MDNFVRDTKRVRNGLALRHSRVKPADRWDRLVLVLVYLLLTGLGLRAIAEYHAGEWSSTN